MAKVGFFLVSSHRVLHIQVRVKTILGRWLDFIKFSDASKHKYYFRMTLLFIRIHSCFCFNKKRICITFTISVLVENYLSVQVLMFVVIFFFFCSSLYSIANNRSILETKHTNRMIFVSFFHFSLWSASRAVECKSEDYFSW